MGKLTAVEVDNITTVGRHADSGGLYLEVDKKEPPPSSLVGRIHRTHP